MVVCMSLCMWLRVQVCECGVCAGLCVVVYGGLCGRLCLQVCECGCVCGSVYGVGLCGCVCSLCLCVQVCVWLCVQACVCGYVCRSVCGGVCGSLCVPGTCMGQPYAIWTGSLSSQSKWGWEWGSGLLPGLLPDSLGVRDGRPVPVKLMS